MRQSCQSRGPAPPQGRRRRAATGVPSAWGSWGAGPAGEQEGFLWLVLHWKQAQKFRQFCHESSPGRLGSTDTAIWFSFLDCCWRQRLASYKSDLQPLPPGPVTVGRGPASWSGRCASASSFSHLDVPRWRAGMIKQGAFFLKNLTLLSTISFLISSHTQNV